MAFIVIGLCLAAAALLGSVASTAEIVSAFRELSDAMTDLQSLLESVSESRRNVLRALCVGRSCETSVAGT